MLLLFTNCKPSLEEISLGKIKIFERNEMRYFKGIHARPFRNYRKKDQIEMEVTIDSVFGNAIIQVHPKQRIYENFPLGRDSIQLDLVSIIDSLEVRGIHNFGDNTQLEFWYEDDYVILFRKNPDSRRGVCGETIPVPVIGDWKYSTVKLKVD